MDRLRIQEHLLRRLELRVGDEMAEYITRRMKDADGLAIPVIAADARTGIPRALELSPGDLNLATEP